MRIKETPSPNQDERKGSCAPDMLILHYTGMTDAASALARLTDRASKVSAHYLIDEDGCCHRLVPEDRRAWHAGLSCWEGTTDINSRSIGIELVNPGHEFGYRPFPDLQISRLLALCQDILGRHAIRPWHVLGHSDVAAARKTDPGELFPWARLAVAGIGLLPEPCSDLTLAVAAPGDRGPSVVALQSHLVAFGYGLAIDGEYAEETATVISALQRHFRPTRIDGVADRETVAILESLRRIKEATV